MSVVDPGKKGAEPRAILKLDPDVVNRIAAGEVVQRPANAVKELIENSLDAGSTSITVTAKQGGLKLLQIQDNGHGIRREDLPIVCERFTTSKLRQFDDLRNMTTFGFRGEALASITHTAKVTITSKTPKSQVAYKARYCDGRLVPAGPGQSADPKPCAGVTGTTILAEDLFYNMDTRRRAFKSPGEQYRGILDVVTRYAVHYGDRGVSFTCKKHGQPSPDLHTPLKSNQLANIRVAFGPVLARELVELECWHSEELLDEARASSGDGETGTPRFAFRAKALMSGANYSSKRSEFILFINDRLVESSSIKKAVEAAYKDVLPKNTHPFVYLGIKMPSRHLDVNVHPTKREVHFLHEEDLLEKLHEAVKDKLSGANESRTFHTQVVLSDMNFGTTASLGDDADVEDERNAAPSRSTPTLPSKEKSKNISDNDDDHLASRNPPTPLPTKHNINISSNKGGNKSVVHSPGTPLPDVPPPPESPLLSRNVGSEDEGSMSDSASDASDNQEYPASFKGKGKGGGRSRKRGRATAEPVDLGSFAAGGGGAGGGKRGGGFSAHSSPSSSNPKIRKGSSRGGGPDSPRKKTAGPVPQKLVRTDRTAGKLDAFLRPSQPFFSPSPPGRHSPPSASPSSSASRRHQSASGDSGVAGASASAVALGGRRKMGSRRTDQCEKIAPQKVTVGDDVAEVGREAADEEEEEGESGDGEELSLGKRLAREATGTSTVDLSQGNDDPGSLDAPEEGLCVCSSPEGGDAVSDGGSDGDGVDEEERERDEEGTNRGDSERGFTTPSPGIKRCRDDEDMDDTSGRKTTKKQKKKASMPFARVGTRPGGKGGRCDCCGGQRPRGPRGSIVLMEQDNNTPEEYESASQTPSKEGKAAMRAQQQHRRPATFVDTQCTYHSVRSLITDFKTQAHKGLTQILKKYSFVGMVDQHLSLLQFNTKLLLANHTELSKEAFFQMTLRRFGVMPRLPLATPLPVLPLIRAALDLPEAAWAERDGDKDELAQDACDLLEEKAAMLNEYFMLKLSREQPAATESGGDETRGEGPDKATQKNKVNAGSSQRRNRGKTNGINEANGDGDEDGNGSGGLLIFSLPLLLEGHTPVPEGLPMFLLRLTTEVDWSEERTCFEGVATELSLYYSTLPEGSLTPTATSTEPELSDTSEFATRSVSDATKRIGVTGGVEGPPAGAGAGAAGTKGTDAGLASPEATAVVQHVMYPAFRWALIPPKGFATDGTVMQLACLERLYKVFERC